MLRHRPWFVSVVLWIAGFGAIVAALRAAADMSHLPMPVGQIFVLAIGLVCIVAGWWLAPVLTLRFDRSAALVEFREQRLFRTRRRHFDLSEVRRVRRQTIWSGRVKLARLALETADGVTPLEIGYTGADRTVVEAAINAWLAGE